jgi:ketosteroid isomerase-like protein
MTSDAGPVAVVERFMAALNRHDLDAMVECCDPDLRAEQPAHPARNFRGRTQFRANWELIFAMVPDLQADMTRCSADGDIVWVEWCWEGRTADGARFERAGVAIHGVRDGRIAWVRVYMQPILSEAADHASVALREMGVETRRTRER